MRIFLQASLMLLIVFKSHAIVGDSIPVYKDPNAEIGVRIQDLLGRMTIEEKVGQIESLFGWNMYTNSDEQVGVSEAFKKAIQERHTGMLWGTFRADPWTQKTLTNGLNPETAAKAANALQKYVIENTRLGIPMILVEESPHGHMAIGATVFPTELGQASTWNPELIQRMASAVANEVRVQGAHIGYGPILDLAREPRWSRFEETFGEDPELVSAMGEAVVKGFQGSGLNSGKNIASTLKHFTAYGVPEGGHNGGSVTIGKRELFQSYLPPFRRAVEAGAQSVMVAYNSIDGIPCSSNTYLLEDILRNEWGFDGFVVSDLNSISGIKNDHHVTATLEESAALSIRAGVDSDLGGNGFAKWLVNALDQKLVGQEVLDTAVARVLKMKFQMGLFENPYVDVATAKKEVRTAAHIDLATEVARESLILLKNEDNLLPLKKETLKKVAVIGPNADNMYNQLGDYTAPQEASNIVTVLEGLKAKLPAGVEVNYVKGCAIRDTTTDEIKNAVKAAKSADVAVVVLGGSSARDFKTSYENTGAAKVSNDVISDMESGEGYDRSTLGLLGKQMELLKKVTATGTPVILVLIEGRPLNINWAAENVDAIIAAWYPGQEGGSAVADVVLGAYNPAGRLPVSVPRSVGQLPVYYNKKNPASHAYVEGSEKPLYPFGYGLSYAQFEYTDLSIKRTGENDEQVFQMTFMLKNTSDVAGDEVAQLYVSDDASSVVTPIKTLKKFARINLKAGEQRQVTFELTAADLHLMNQDFEWVTEPGSFSVQIGASSDDIRLKDSFVWE